MIDLLETIDDDLDGRGFKLVKISDPNQADEYGLENLPQIVYFENGIPTLFKEPFDDADDILRWFLEQLQGDEIEDVNEEMLRKILKGEQGGTGVIFCKYFTWIITQTHTLM